jgi:hypothetical protein
MTVTSVTDPRDWYNVGVEHLANDRVQEAAWALKQAEQRGYVDAGHPLGLAYRRLGELADAEQAWLRVLEYTSCADLRWRTAGHLAELYRDLGAPSAHMDMHGFLTALRWGMIPRRPRTHVYRTSAGGYSAHARGGLTRQLRVRWNSMSTLGRSLVTMLSALGLLVSLVERFNWLVQVLMR